MRTIQVKLYKFNELGKEAKEKVLEKHREWNVEFDEWYDCLFENWKEKLDKVGFEDAKIEFSGFWSQGDGACFTAHCNMANLLSRYLHSKTLVNFIMENVDMSASIETMNHHYSHANTKNFQLNWDSTQSLAKVLKAPTADLPLLLGEDMDESDKNIYELRVKKQIGPIDMDKLQEDLEEYRTDLCNEIYRDLEKEYNYLTSDEAVIESLEANDREFTVDGDDA